MSIVEVATRPLKCLTEQAVTEWTEATEWTESTEAHEAKRSASALSEAGKAKCLAAVSF